MDPRLLRAYNEELAYLRETSREFGAEHDVVAGHLGLKTPTDPTPMSSGCWRAWPSSRRG